ncbi:MAG: ABC transporter ATP-binding protein [Candidatus Ornithospirochaeta sp.]
MRQNYKKDEASSKVSKRETVRRILQYTAAYRGRVVLISVMAIVAAAMKTVVPMFTEYAVDVNIAEGDAKGLVTTVALAVSCGLVWGILAILRDNITVSIANDVVYRARTEAYANILSLPLGFFDSRPSGRIITRIINDCDKMKDITKSLTSNLIPNLIFLIFVMAMMLYLNPMLAIASFVVIPFLVVTSYFIIVRGYSNWENFRKKESNLTAFVHEDYAGIRAVQSFGAECETTEECDRLLSDVQKGWEKAVRRSDAFGIVVNASVALGYVFLFLCAVYWMEEGTTTVGEILAFISYIGLFWQPIRSLASLYNQIINNLSAAARVFEIMDEESDITEAEDAFDINVVRGDVEFRNVTFSYPDDEETNIVENISFSVKGGETVALVGPTGAGKTTIINMIARFYDSVEGEILIDGQPIRKASFASLRRNVTVMPQDSVLFSGTIRENLMYGREVDESVMKEKIEELNLTSLIDSLPSGYDTLVKDAGLSSGQKQLIALARTLIADPKVLILDEATSNVDTRTELMVQKGLKVLMKGRTSFIVAHRLSTIRNADEIFVVGNKTIMERGDHDSLMKIEDGEYRSLYLAQFALVKENGKLEA